MIRASPFDLIVTDHCLRPLIAALPLILSIETTLAQTVDYDQNNNGLIEVDSVRKLNAIRWDLNGNGRVDNAANAADYRTAFPGSASNLGCPASGCKGYELTRDLDLHLRPYNTGQGWTPIGNNRHPFAAVFQGNRHTISNLFISRSGSDQPIGLFGSVGMASQISRLGLTGVNITGQGEVGGLTGANQGTIIASYVIGTVRGSGNVGGLMGTNCGTITTSYITGTVRGSGNNSKIGGLVGLYAGSRSCGH